MAGMFGFDKESKKVEYLELIYDLIFVYLIGRNGSLVVHVENGFINPNLFLTYILCTLVIIQIWNYTNFYINRYGSNGIREHIGIFINMYLLYFMADATNAEWGDSFYRYNIAWALILINLGIQYAVQLKNSDPVTPWVQSHIRWNMGILFVQAGLVFALIPFYTFFKWPITPLAMVFGIVASFVSDRVNRLVRVDFEHLSERAMLYIVFTFGEMIIAIASYFRGNFSFSTIYFSIFGFLIVIGLFLSYEILYDHLLDKEMNTTGNVYMLLHIFLIFALNAITTALEFMQESEVALLPKTIFMSASLLLYYVFLFALGPFCKTKHHPTPSFLLKIVLAGAVFVVLMLVFREQMYINIAITVALVAAVLIMLFRFRRQCDTCT